jgi:anti-sigma factor RsiW
MTITRADITAFVDGEADAGQSSRIAAAALADPGLARTIAAERALRETLKAHFAPMTEEPVPSRWIEQIRAANRESAEVVDLASARERKARAADGQGAARWWRNPWAGAAIAASLVVGLFAGTQWRASSPIEVRGGALVASGDLVGPLDSRLASAGDAAAFRILGTFRGSGGEVCRAFSGRQASGIACHERGGWQLRHVLPGTTPSATEYRQAGSHDAELMALAQGMAASELFDLKQERDAMARGWR